MFILPIGHEKGIRRTPFVTAGIMVICTMLQAYQSFGTPSDGELEEKILARQEVMVAIARDLMRADVEEEGLEESARMIGGGAEDDEEEAAWESVYARAEARAEQ